LTAAEGDEATLCFATGAALTPEIDVIATAPTAAIVAEAERGNVIMTGTFHFRSRWPETRTMGAAEQPWSAQPRRDASLMLEASQALAPENGTFADREDGSKVEEPGERSL
jgi:hypothetical protein